MMNSVKRIFLRRSGVLNARPKAVSTGPPEVRPGVVAASSTIRHKIPVDAGVTGIEGLTPHAAGLVPEETRDPALRHMVMGGGQAVVAEPPAASIFSLALAENALAVTLTATVISPLPSTFTRCPSRTAPLATRSSMLTSPPSG